MDLERSSPHGAILNRRGASWTSVAAAVLHLNFCAVPKTLRGTQALGHGRPGGFFDTKSFPAKRIVLNKKLVKNLRVKAGLPIFVALFHIKNSIL